MLIRGKIPENRKPDLAAAFGMELAAGDVFPLQNGSKTIPPVRRYGQAVFFVVSPHAVGMHEIHERAFGDPGQNRAVPAALGGALQSVPGDLRNLKRPLAGCWRPEAHYTAFDDIQATVNPVFLRL